MKLSIGRVGCTKERTIDMVILSRTGVYDAYLLQRIVELEKQILSMRSCKNCEHEMDHSVDCVHQWPEVCDKWEFRGAPK
jgi:hypothetical protein